MFMGSLVINGIFALSGITISGIFALLGVIVGAILGFFLQLISTMLSEKKMLKKEFEMIKADIYYIEDEKSENFKLFRLKYFFKCNHNILKKEENKTFFKKWLEKTEGNWDRTKFDAMINDLDKTRF